MTTNLTSQTAPVTERELDQMIWKLERDGGMTPKLLSLMRELREWRKAKGEPVGYIDAEYASMLKDGDIDKCHLYKDHFDGALPLHTAYPSLNAAKLNQSVSKTNLAATQIKPVADLYGITSPTGS